MAPNCMVTSKTLCASDCWSFIRAEARIRCPVEEIGRNSLSPSTMPSIIASIVVNGNSP